MLKFSCTCQDYNGYLNVSAEECNFTSPMFRVELKWSNVKKIKLDTKQIKGVPTSVLVIGLNRTVSVDDNTEIGSSGRRKGRKKKSASNKYFFYGFQDLLTAEERIKGTWELWKRENASAAKETTRRGSDDDVYSGEENDSTTARRAGEVDSGGSTHAEADTSLPSSRVLPTARTTGISDARVTAQSFPSPKRTTTLPVHRRAGVDVLTPETNSAVKSVAERVLVVTARWFTQALQYFLTGGLVSTLVFLFVVCLLAVTVSQIRHSTISFISPPPGEQLEETKRLLESIQQTFAYQRELGQYVSLDDYYSANKKKNAVLEPGAVWVERLEKAAKELAARYVLIQAEMLNLRGRRAERLLAVEMGVSPSAEEAWHRVFQEGDSHHQRKYYLTDAASSAHEPAEVYDNDNGDASEADEEGGNRKPSRGRPRFFSTRRIFEDLDFWRRAVAMTASGVRYVIALGGSGGGGGGAVHANTRQPRSELLRFFSTAQNDGGKSTLLVRYTEPFLEGYDIAQYIVPAEEAERQECLRISNDLAKVSDLIENVFLCFTALLMSNSYERIAAGFEKPHFWGSAPHPTSASLLTTGVHGNAALRGLPVFTSDEVLRVVFIRRYVETLQHLEPLEPNEPRRRAAALAFSQRLHAFMQHDSVLTQHPNRTNKDNLLQSFYDMILARGFTGHPSGSSSSLSTTSILRNIVEEVRFWRRHEELWMEHLLNSLPQSHRAKLRELSELRYGRGDDRSRKPTAKRPSVPKGRGRSQDASCAVGANGTTDDLLRCRSQLYWENLPTFKGLLCFTPQPQLRRVSDSGDGASREGAARRPPRRSASGSKSSTASSSPAVDLAANKKAWGDTAKAASEGEQPTEESSSWPVNDSEDGNGMLDGAEEGGGDSTNVARAKVPVKSRYANRYATSLSAEEEIRRMFDPSRLENAVTLTKERWMGELDMFMRALSADKEGPAPSRSTHRRQRSFHLEQEEENVDPQMAASRARLLTLIEQLNHVYLLPIYQTSSRVLLFVSKWCWPPSWIRAALRREERHPDLEAIRVMATDDPAAQLAAAQIVQSPWGTNKDAPLILLRHVLLQSPELLKLRISLWNRLVYSWLLFAVSVVALVVAYLFL